MHIVCSRVAILCVQRGATRAALAGLQKVKTSNLICVLPFLCSFASLLSLFPSLPFFAAPAGGGLCFMTTSNGVSATLFPLLRYDSVRFDVWCFASPMQNSRWEPSATHRRSHQQCCHHRKSVRPGVIVLECNELNLPSGAVDQSGKGKQIEEGRA